jgi:Domain of unknown function (DUF4270)
MQKLFYDSKSLLFSLSFGAAIFSSCEKTKIQFGQDYVDNTYTNIILVDTLSPELSTVYSDSAATSASGAILVGNYIDNTFGKISAKSFFEVIPPVLSDIATNSAYDSLVLILRPNKTYYGDTTTISHLSIYQLKTQLEFPANQTAFYNTTDFVVNNTALGSLNTFISPNKTDSVFIRLNDTKGQELFNLYKSQQYEIQSNENFLKYFKGLQIASTGGNMQGIFGFHDSVIVRLHYHETNLYREHKYMDFNYYNDSKQFNQVIANRTGTPLSVFNTINNEIVSSSTNNTAYIQSITGFVAKIKFPTIRSLLLRPDYLKILKAELILKPVKNSYNYYTPLPAQLSDVTTNQSNTTLGSTLSTANVVIDQLYNEDTYYSYDVTSYLQQQILVMEANQNGLLFFPPDADFSSKLNRAIIGDKKNSSSRLQLKLYYVSINP